VRSGSPRRELLAKEKALARHRDEVSAARRALPMVEITEDYSFDGPHGRASLLDLFDGRSQLLIYHLMFEPDADEACPSCSFTMDNVGHLSHLHARDTSFAAVSRAPLQKLEDYRQRMGWTFPWYKDQAELERMDPAWKGWSGEEQGVSAFLRQGERVFHTYSGYARGTEILMGTYQWLDLTARGRQEEHEPPPRRGDDPIMSWLRRHDDYV